MLNLDLSEEQRLLSETFARFFSEQSTIARVRAAEPSGFEEALYRSFAKIGGIGVRTPEAAGGSGTGLLDAILIAQEAGRHLASAPIVESIVAARLLAELGGPICQEWLGRLLTGEVVVSLALHDARTDDTQIVPAGAIADAVLTLHGDSVSLLVKRRFAEVSPNHGSQPFARLRLAGDQIDGDMIELKRGEAARAAFLRGIEEWKILTAAQLNGLARRALELAVDYARERKQFGRPIGSFQAIAHPLADCAIDVDAAQLFNWWTVHLIAKSSPQASAVIPMSFWLSCQIADSTTRRAMHTFGGYGVTVEYDIQLYFRRAGSLRLVLGDPLDQLAEGGRRLWVDANPQPLPDAGNPELDFDFGAEADALAAEMRALLERVTTPEWRENAHYSYAGFDPVVVQKIGAAGMLHPSWPKKWGGRGAHPYAASAALAVWNEFNITRYGQSTAHYVGAVVMECGSPELKEEVLHNFARGVKNPSMGYSEPEAGSDVYAARTRAVWDEARQEWVINGQKMFTSGIEVNDYIFLLTRTDPEAPKHAGLTMFLVPKTAAGVEVHPVHTMQDERTNVTFYADVRLPDRYRVGPVNGGLAVLGAALRLEHGAGFSPGEHGVVEAAVAWARQSDQHGKRRIDDKNTLVRIARAKVSAYVSELLAKRAMYFGVTNPGVRGAFGPMSKVFRTEAYQRDMADLISLTAPDSLFHDRHGLGEIELGHRHAQATTIYGGTSEIHRSTIAELGLGLPRSR